MAISARRAYEANRPADVQARLSEDLNEAVATEREFDALLFGCQIDALMSSR